MKHTLGPWKAHPSEGTWAGWLVSPPGEYTIAAVYWAQDADGNAHYNAEANALLIAAAPELLEALKALYEHTKNNRQICSINEMARAAIAKAEGRETI